MKTQTKCFWCRGKSNKGCHDLCWKEFKGFMLSDKTAVDRPTERGLIVDDIQPQNFKDQAGHIVIQGRVVVPSPE